MKPFLKWAGNKYRIVDRVRAVLPSGKRLIEPFVGSGAVFLNTSYTAYLLTDSNADLIDLYRELQCGGDEFIAYCQSFFTNQNNQAEAYYPFREEFNRTDDRRKKAALFLYLNKHCYNGLCRYNAKGKFNTPFGRHKKPYFPTKEMHLFWQHAQTAEFRVSDFVSAMSDARPGDIVYCDPPYVPLSETANFTSYSSDAFGFAAQQELARQAMKLAEDGIPVVISNHDTTQTRQLYSGAEIISFEVQRFISSKGAQRGKARELLAVFK